MTTHEPEQRSKPLLIHVRPSEYAVIRKAAFGNMQTVSSYMYEAYIRQIVAALKAQAAESEGK